MKVSELGEFGLIDILAGMAGAAGDKNSVAGRQLVLGIGDDAAAWRCEDALQLGTVDVLVQDVHFTLETTTWAELGWKALAVNMSDIAAMGGFPRYALVSLSLPGMTEVDRVKELYNGMLKLSRQYGMAIIGGNMSSAPVVIINVTVLGDTGPNGEHILKRSAARPGDKIAVTGHPGTAAAGLEMLTKGITATPEQAKSMRAAFLAPSPRVKEGALLVEYGVKVAIDISDGLMADLGHLCKMSKVGARIEMDRLPVHPAVKAMFPDKAIDFALSGGEDYELLFCAGTDVFEGLRSETATLITIIGEITADNAGGVTVIDSAGNAVNTPIRGWDHFAGEKTER